MPVIFRHIGLKSNKNISNFLPRYDIHFQTNRNSTLLSSLKRKMCALWRALKTIMHLKFWCAFLLDLPQGVVICFYAKKSLRDESAIASLLLILRHNQCFFLYQNKLLKPQYIYTRITHIFINENWDTSTQTLIFIVYFVFLHLTLATQVFGKVLG